MSDITKVAIVGCGNISNIYFKNLALLEGVEVAACHDLLPDAAKARAEQYNVPAKSMEEILADQDIEIILNLTIPKAHYDVAMAAVQAGKHVYNEKPLCLSRELGQKLLDEAKKKGVLVGGAPDTFLGGGIQTCRKLIDDGWIGDVIGADAYMLCRGHETWHPNPEFYYEPGGGPMFDMGPYYLTALVNLVGPVRRVTGSVGISFPQRTITSQPKFGKVIDVETATHITGVLDFQNGAIGTITTSFDISGHKHPKIHIFGSRGTILTPDPNTFGGPVFLNAPGKTDGFQEIPMTHGYHENSRGLGVADLAKAARAGRGHRASGELCFHVLDIMCAIQEASDQGKHIELTSKCERPAPLPLGLRDMTID
ncbi:MAG: Gfo/Idh/MocA family protein [Candidatus Sumerlaeia bacterium]